MATRNEGYFSRSWALLTKDKGWIKPVLVLAAAHFVPIVGAFGANGYALEWARLTAWGVDAAPKQKNVNISACIRTGARAFVVTLGYGLALGLINSILQRILGDILGSVFSIGFGIIAFVLMTVASLRATIYQSISAGFEIDRLVDMIKRDYDGLLHIAGMTLGLTMALALLTSVLFGGVMLASMGDVIGSVMEYERYGGIDDWEMVVLILGWLGSIFPILCVMGYVVGIFGVIVNLLEVTAVGLWMRQFDVRNWGASSDPLPNTRVTDNAWDAGAGSYGAYDTGYQQPTNPSSYQQPTNPPYGGGNASAATSWDAGAVNTPNQYAPSSYDAEIPQPIPQAQEVPQPGSTQPNTQGAPEVSTFALPIIDDGEPEAVQPAATTPVAEPIVDAEPAFEQAFAPTFVDEPVEDAGQPTLDESVPAAPEAAPFTFELPIINDEEPEPDQPASGSSEEESFSDI